MTYIICIALAVILLGVGIYELIKGIFDIALFGIALCLICALLFDLYFFG